MRIIPWMVLASLISACQQSESSLPANSSVEQSASETGDGNADSAARSETGLSPGLYEIKIVETITGLATSPEQVRQECIDRGMAAHPETFLAQGSSQGCRATSPIRDGQNIRSELRCDDNYTLALRADFEAESWHQTVSGSSPNGSYESRETAHRIGDC